MTDMKLGSCKFVIEGKGTDACKVDRDSDNDIDDNDNKELLSNDPVLPARGKGLALQQGERIQEANIQPKMRNFLHNRISIS